MKRAPPQRTHSTRHFETTSQRRATRILLRKFCRQPHFKAQIAFAFGTATHPAAPDHFPIPLLQWNGSPVKCAPICAVVEMNLRLLHERKCAAMAQKLVPRSCCDFPEAPDAVVFLFLSWCYSDCLGKILQQSESFRFHFYISHSCLIHEMISGLYA